MNKNLTARKALPPKAAFVVMFVATTSIGFAQGTVRFLNRFIGVDARITFENGSGVGEGFTAQLYGGPVTAPRESLAPLFPMATFRTSSRAAMGYLEPVDVLVPGVAPLSDAKFFVRVFEGATWESSLCRGESNSFVTSVGGGDRPPSELFGLQAFTVICIPEPSTFALFGCGVMLFGSATLLRGKLRKLKAIDFRL